LLIMTKPRDLATLGGGFTQSGTGAIQRTVENKLKDTVSVKDFGAVGDGATNDRAAIQAAYNYVANAGGGTISWPKASYIVNGTIYFGSNTRTDFGKSIITGNGSTLFTTGYVSGGVLVANTGTANTCDQSGFEGGTIYNTGGIAFRLTNFRFYSYLRDIVCFNVSQIVVGTTCFYSHYENLIYFGNTDFAQCSAATTSGNAVITVTNAVATTLSSGMEVCSQFVPSGTTITTVGAANSAGAGFASITLSTAATLTGADGSGNSGFIASLNPKALYEFSTANSDLYFKQCSAGSKFKGFQLNEINSCVFDSCDIESCGYGFVFTGGSGNNTFNGLHTESMFGYIWNYAGNTQGGSVYINGYNAFNIAGIITAGASGYVEGTLNIPRTNTPNPPYGFTNNGESWVDLSSPNAKMVVLGGGNDTNLKNASSPSTFLSHRGLKLPNIAQTDSKTLDWYEEGTFTPTIEGSTTAGAGTYTIQSGTFTRIGNRIFFTIRLGWSAHTGTGNILIAGWPATPALVYREIPAVASDLVYTVGKSLAISFGGASFTKASLVEHGASAAVANVAIDSAAEILVNGHYEL
jgi:hypothetical protein